MAAAAQGRIGARKRWPPNLSATEPASQRDRAAATPKINNTSAAVRGWASWGEKVSTAPPAIVTLNSTTVGGTMPSTARALGRLPSTAWLGRPRRAADKAGISGTTAG